MVLGCKPLIYDAEGRTLPGRCCLILPCPERIAQSLLRDYTSVILFAEICPVLPYSLAVG